MTQQLAPDEGSGHQSSQSWHAVDQYKSPAPVVICYKPPVAKFMQMTGLALSLLITVGAATYCFAVIIALIDLLIRYKRLFIDSEDFIMIWHLFTTSLMVFFGLKLLRFFLYDQMRLTQDGIMLPFFLRGLLPFKTFLPWQEILGCTISGRGVNQTLQLKLSHAQSLSFNLQHFAGISDMERFAISLRSKCSALKNNSAIFAMIESFRAQSPSGVDSVNYTKIWLDGMEQRAGSSISSPLREGSVFYDGRLQVLEVLSARGLLATYLCLFDDSRLVVVREHVQAVGSTSSQKALELLRRETALLLKLDHPRIAKVFDAFESKNRSYLVLEYIEGRTLKEFISTCNGLLPLEYIVDLLIQLTKILQYLHLQTPAIIHRDVSPENLLLDERGNIYLIDFGTANQFASGSTGTIVGKTSFMPPEQFKGKFGEESDIYALGCVAYNMATGCPPLALQQCHPKQLRADLPDEFDQLIASCTEQDSRDRIGRASELLQRLEHLQAGWHKE